jgi:hypothetical protein
MIRQALARGAVASALLAVALLTTAALAWPWHAAAQATAQPPAARYQYNPPAGWSRAQDGDTEVLSPGSEAAGSAQALLLAPKPLAGDFFQQFEAERTQLEQFWGLRAPMPVAPQRGQSVQGPYTAYFASYDSDGGPRYMSFLAQAQGQQVALVVFVATSHDVFNRVAPQVTEMFTSLRVVGP